MVDHGNPRQPLDHEGDRLMKPRNRPVGGEMAFQPAGLGGEMAGIENQPADLPYELGWNIGDLRRRPPIHPGEARRQRIAVRIDGDAAVELAAESDRPYGGWFGAPGCQRLGDRGPQGGFPKPGILLDPTRPRMADRIAAHRPAPHAQGRIQHCNLEGLAADIDADDHPPRTPQVCALSSMPAPAPWPGRRS